MKASITFGVVIRLEDLNKKMVNRFRRVQRDLKTLMPLDGDSTHAADVAGLLEDLTAIARRARASKPIQGK